MTKFFNKFKKLCFGPIFGPFSQFWGQKLFFLENPALPCTTSYEFRAPYQNLGKTNDTISRKCPNRWKGRRTDRTYFIVPFWLPPQVQKLFKILEKYV